MPALLKPDLEYHLATYAAPGKKGLLFSARKASRCDERAGTGRGTER